MHNLFINQSLTILLTNAEQANFLAEHGQCGRQ